MASASVGSVSLVNKNPISKLSADHFSIIVQFLENQDIRSARLAGREFHFFLSPYLFRSVRFAPRRECLDILGMISQNDLFSPNVRILRFDISLLQLPDIWEEQDLWNLRLENTWDARDWIYGQPTRRHRYQNRPWSRWSALQLQALEEYDAFGAEQSSINNELETHLTRILDAFPGISTIIFTNTSIKSATRFANLPQKNSHSSIWIRPFQFTALINAISRSRCNITKIDIEGYWKQVKFMDNCDFGDDSLIPGSIKYAFPDFEHARYWREQKPAIASFTFDLTHEKFSAIQPLFNNLTCLSLSITSAVPMEDLDLSPSLVPNSYWLDLPEVLGALSNITHLSLNLNVYRHVDQQLVSSYYHDDIAEIFNDSALTLPHLASLRLTRFRSRGPSLLSLLQRHPKIENLTLRHIIEIINPDFLVNPYALGRRIGFKWVEVLETMRELCLKRLDLCGIEGFGIDWARAGSENTNLLLARVHDYILYRYGENPLRPGRDSNNWDAELWGETSLEDPTERMDIGGGGS